MRPPQTSGGYALLGCPAALSEPGTDEEQPQFKGNAQHPLADGNVWEDSVRDAGFGWRRGWPRSTSELKKAG